jgi:hypothetical protein
MNFGREQIIMLIDGLMDKEKRAGTIAFAAPVLGNAIGNLLSNGVDSAVKHAKDEAGRQLAGVFSGGGVSGNPTSDMKESVHKIAEASAKGFAIGVVGSFFPDQS